LRRRSVKNDASKKKVEKLTLKTFSEKFHGGIISEALTSELIGELIQDFLSAHPSKKKGV
jgi:hypothetical protein